jgi:hypothetical protein
MYAALPTYCVVPLDCQMFTAGKSNSKRASETYTYYSSVTRADLEIIGQDSERGLHKSYYTPSPSLLDEKLLKIAHNNHNGLLLDCTYKIDKPSLIGQHITVNLDFGFKHREKENDVRNEKFSPLATSFYI